MSSLFSKVLNSRLNTSIPTKLQVELYVERMQEKLYNIVDAKGLKQSKELQCSIEDDAKRVTINSVKLRAAAQNVDYPAFAALVSDDPFTTCVANFMKCFTNLLQ